MSLVVGDKLTLTIDDVAFGGEGVGRFDNFVVFIPFVAPGEVVEVELTEVKRRFARGKLTKVLKPAAIRVEPLCPYFGECGGCQYQHLEYPAQLKLKHKQLQDLFERVGHLDRCVIDPVVPCPQPYHYRNRIMVRSQWNKPRQRLDVGFIRADNRLVVDVEECKIAEPGLNRQLLEVRANPPPRGGLKVVLRIPPEGWQVPPDSFFQNNFFLLPKLLEAVRDRVLGSGSKYLIDVYCGVGFFSIELAGQVTSFAGVEIDRMAIESARKNAAARGCTNGEFLIGQAEELIPELLMRFPPSETTVVLDPPRKGCAPQMLEALCRNRPGQVIYISCNPATMARDLNILCAEGVFELAQVTPLDMFPHTQHVECVADLRCRQQPGAAG